MDRVRRWRWQRGPGSPTSNTSWPSTPRSVAAHSSRTLPLDSGGLCAEPSGEVNRLTSSPTTMSPCCAGPPVRSPPMSTELPLSVWPVAQRSAPAQRRGRYLPLSGHHPAKMLPAIAARAVATYTGPGDLVLDPMCGIGTTLVEAVHLGRDAIGVEYEARWAELAAAGVTRARRDGAAGAGQVIRADARQLPQAAP